jgi:hypothetical protein
MNGNTSPQSTIVAQSFRALKPVSLSTLKPLDNRRLPNRIPVGPKRALVNVVRRELPWSIGYACIEWCANDCYVEFVFCFVCVSWMKTIDKGKMGECYNSCKGSYEFLVLVVEYVGRGELRHIFNPEWSLVGQYNSKKSKSKEIERHHGTHGSAV